MFAIKHERVLRSERARASVLADESDRRRIFLLTNECQEHASRVLQCREIQPDFHFILPELI